MEVTKAIYTSSNSLGFEVGENPAWRGEFTLEQVAEFDIKPGKPLNVHLLEMEDTFASVEFEEGEKTTVPITKVPESSELFSPAAPADDEPPNLDDTLRG